MKVSLTPSAIYFAVGDVTLFIYYFTSEDSANDPESYFLTALKHFPAMLPY